MSEPQMRGGPLLGFWPALLLVLSLSALAGLTYGLAASFLVVVLALQRQKLRRKYEHPELPSHGGLVTDLLAWGCCCWCAAVQEARHVRHTRTLKHVRYHVHVHEHGHGHAAEGEGAAVVAAATAAATAAAAAAVDDAETASTAAPSARSSLPTARS